MILNSSHIIKGLRIVTIRVVHVAKISLPIHIVLHMSEVAVQAVLGRVVRHVWLLVLDWRHRWPVVGVHVPVSVITVDAAHLSAKSLRVDVGLAHALTVNLWNKRTVLEVHILAHGLVGVVLTVLHGFTHPHERHLVLSHVGSIDHILAIENKATT